MKCFSLINKVKLDNGKAHLTTRYHTIINNNLYNFMTKEIKPSNKKCQFIHGIEMRDIDRLVLIVLKTKNSCDLDEIKRFIINRTKKELFRINLHRRLLFLISKGLIEVNELKTEYELSDKTGKRQIYYNLTNKGEENLKTFLEDLGAVLYFNKRELCKKVDFI